MLQSLDLILVEEEGELHLCSPEVGHFSCCVPQGALLSAGQPAGVIRKLGQSLQLVVPPGTAGRVSSPRPELVNAPVGYGTRLYTLVPLSAEDHTGGGAGKAKAGDPGAPSFRSPHSGRFWHRPSPSDPAFAEVGSTIQAGDPIGLIEVMKTFTHLNYAPGDELPQRAEVTRILVGDGEEVSEGDVLLELKPAGA